MTETVLTIAVYAWMTTMAVGGLGLFVAFWYCLGKWVLEKINPP